MATAPLKPAAQSGFVSDSLDWGGAFFKFKGFVQLVALLVLMTLVVSHWLVEPMVLLLQPFFVLSWLPWVFLGAGLWLLAGDDPPNSGP